MATSTPTPNYCAVATQTQILLVRAKGQGSAKVPRPWLGEPDDFEGFDLQSPPGPGLWVWHDMGSRVDDAGEYPEENSPVWRGLWLRMTANQAASFSHGWAPWDDGQLVDDEELERVSMGEALVLLTEELETERTEAWVNGERAKDLLREVEALTAKLESLEHPNHELDGRALFELSDWEVGWLDLPEWERGQWTLAAARLGSRLQRLQAAGRQVSVPFAGGEVKWIEGVVDVPVEDRRHVCQLLDWALDAGVIATYGTGPQVVTAQVPAGAKAAALCGMVDALLVGWTRERPAADLHDGWTFTPQGPKRGEYSIAINFATREFSLCRGVELLHYETLAPDAELTERAIEDVAIGISNARIAELEAQASTVAAAPAVSVINGWTIVARGPMHELAARDGYLVIVDYEANTSTVASPLLRFFSLSGHLNGVRSREQILTRALEIADQFVVEHQRQRDALRADALRADALRRQDAIMRAESLRSEGLDYAADQVEAPSVHAHGGIVEAVRKQDANLCAEILATSVPVVVPAIAELAECVAPQPEHVSGLTQAGDVLGSVLDPTGFVVFKSPSPMEPEQAPRFLESISAKLDRLRAELEEVAAELASRG